LQRFTFRIPGRLIVLLFLCALMFILYLDRIVMSKAVNPIQKELDLSEIEMSFVLMAFTLAYGLFEVPTGHWGDRIGARAVLTRIAVWWSVFTMLTACCFGLYSLIAIRFLFGAGEAGALPNGARVISRWFPIHERGKVQGLLQTMALVGGAVSPMVAAYVIQGFGWRMAFILFGIPGVLWALLFWVWFRDDPADHSAVNKSELEVIGPAPRPVDAEHAAIPWRVVARTPTVWLLGFVISCAAFNTYLYFSWFPKYLETARLVDPLEAGWLSSLVLAGGAIGTLSGGFLNDFLVRRWANQVLSRRLFGGISFSLAAVALALGIQCDSPSAMACFAALSCLFATSTLSMWWSCAAEASGRYVGALFGLMNGMGVVGAMASQFFFGACAEYHKSLGFCGRGQWDPAFWVYVGVLLLAAWGWTAYTAHVVEAKEDQR